MKNITKTFFLAAVLAACSTTFAAQPAATKAPAKPVTHEIERDIPYAELGRFIGKRVIVHSTLGTVRSGTLTHYTQSQIDIKLDAGGADVSFERDSIKSVGEPYSAEEVTGSDSAKKN